MLDFDFVSGRTTPSVAGSLSLSLLQIHFPQVLFVLVLFPLVLKNSSLAKKKFFSPFILPFLKLVRLTHKLMFLSISPLFALHLIRV